MVDFLKSNVAYILWFCIYVFITWGMLGGTVEMLVIVLAIYTISISIALSPLGEFLLRLWADVRIPRTSEEKNYIEPIFEDVYNNVLEECPKMRKDIKIHIIDVMYVNAFAIGGKTIAITRGALSTFTEDELRGVIAHEFGHIKFGHTKALLLSVIGNAIFSFFILILRIFMILFELCLLPISIQHPILELSCKGICFITRIIMDFFILVFLYVGNIILKINSRSNEYQADEFAYTLGLGEELTSALYLLQKISMSHKMTIKEKILSSHPHISKRIERLENKEEEL